MLTKLCTVPQIGCRLPGTDIVCKSTTTHASFILRGTRRRPGSSDDVNFARTMQRHKPHYVFSSHVVNYLCGSYNTATRRRDKALNVRSLISHFLAYDHSNDRVAIKTP
jgi:hypothetical protein